MEETQAQTQSTSDRIAFAAKYLEGFCAHFDLPVPKVVEQESKVVGVTFDVLMTDQDYRSLTSSTKLKHPELRLSRKTLTQLSDASFRFELSSAVLGYVRMRRLIRIFLIGVTLAAVPIAICFIIGQPLLAILCGIVTILTFFMLSMRSTMQVRRKTFLDVVRYTGEPSALREFLQKPRTLPLWYPQFLRRFDEKGAEKERAVFNDLLIRENLG